MAIKTKTELKEYNDTNITTNGVRAITGAITHTLNEDMIDSLATEDYVDNSRFNIYNIDGSLDSNRTMNLNSNNLIITDDSSSTFGVQLTDSSDNASNIYSDNFSVLINAYDINTFELCEIGLGKGEINLSHFNASAEGNMIVIGETLTIVDDIGKKGISYGGNYEANYSDNSLVSKHYIDKVTNEYFTNGTGTSSIVSKANQTSGGDASGDYSIANGSENVSSAIYSSVIGGSNNTILTGHINSAIIGGNQITSDNSNTTYTQTLKTKGTRKVIKTIDADYTLTQFDEVLRITSSDDVDVTLPLLNSENNGQVYYIKTIKGKYTLANIRLLVNSADAFDDDTTIYTFTSMNEVIEVVGDSDSNQWVVLNTNTNA